MVFHPVACNRTASSAPVHSSENSIDTVLMTPRLSKNTLVNLSCSLDLALTTGVPSLPNVFFIKTTSSIPVASDVSCNLPDEGGRYARLPTRPRLRAFQLGDNDNPLTRQS